ncbi:FG-GAP repeat protein [Marinicella rhabdoformis]|uniref:FG-GAP repeat protein n=1 Tax=Marinicella rhabdoformis TaxID=2580566 RepID=UPI0012AECE7B|nr:FG-GAP repeat protein [Marinicella rhabdoformis]
MNKIIACIILASAYQAAIADTEWVNDLQPTPLTFSGYGDGMAIMDEWMAVGDPLNDDQDTDAGAVYIYNNSSGQWLLYQTLYADDAGLRDELGSSVDIERKHDTGELWVVASALKDDDVNLDNGAVYAWHLDDMGVFVQQEKFTGVNLISQNFGSSIALNYDYISEIDAELWVLVVGDDFKRHQVMGQTRATGGVTVFKKLAGPGHQWEEEPVQTGMAYLDTLTSVDQIGHSVSIDGSTIIAGAPGDDDHTLPNNDGTDMGAIHVLTRDNLTQTWSCCGIAYPDYRERSAQFGYDVEVIKQPNNNRIIMATAPYEKDQNNRPKGSAYVWFNSLQVQRIEPQIQTGTSGEFFGGSIAANGDEYFGSTELLIGSHFSNNQKGRIYHYSINPNYDGISDDLYLLKEQIVAHNRDQSPWDVGQFGFHVSTDGKNHATSSVANRVGNHKSVYTAELPIFKNGFQAPTP